MESAVMSFVSVAGDTGHPSDTGLSLRFTLYSMPRHVHSHSLNLPFLLKTLSLKT